MFGRIPQQPCDATDIARALLLPKDGSAMGSGQIRGRKFLLQEILDQHQQGDSH